MDEVKRFIKESDRLMAKAIKGGMPKLRKLRAKYAKMTPEERTSKLCGQNNGH